MEDLEQLKERGLHYARGIWEHRWIAIAITWLVLICGVIGVDQIKNRYKAETKVFIDSTSVLGPLLSGLAIQTDFQAIVKLMVKQLLSRPNLERAIRIMDMDISVDGKAGMEALIGSTRARIGISAGRRSGGVYTITYTDTDRLKARKMVQTLLDIFVEDTLGESVNESDSAIDFLNQQIEKYDGLLREAEDRRENFKRKNMQLMPRDGVDFYGQSQNAENQLQKVQLTLSELRNRRDKIKLKIEEFKSENINQEVVIKTSLDDRIEVQENRLDELLLLYTEEHPDVINSLEVLKSLRARKEQEVVQITATKSILDNPVYQQLQILLSKTEADISSVEARIKSVQKEQAKLKMLVDIVPKIEAEMQRLNRDYAVHKENYTALVGRRETARISEDVEARSDRVKFRIIEPPYVPIEPDYPNRPLFDAAVLVLAIGTGYGLSLLISLFQPIFYNQKDLTRFIGGAVLGAVNKFDTPNVLSKRRKSLVLFVFANLSLLSTGGILIILHAQGMQILNRLQSMVM